MTVSDLFDSYSGDWCSIWKLKIPSKVKLRLWRIARGVLPCCYNLRRRHVQCLEKCMLCESTMESERHLFFECSQAQFVWRSAGLWRKMSQCLSKGGFQRSLSLCRHYRRVLGIVL